MAIHSERTVLQRVFTVSHGFFYSPLGFCIIVCNNFNNMYMGVKKMIWKKNTREIIFFGGGGGTHRLSLPFSEKLIC
jgi:hypothetical protein